MLVFFDLFGTLVFAMTGALVAARRRLDIVGFMWLSVVTAIGGGTVRDLILERPVFWLNNPVYLYVALAAAVGVYAGAHWIHRIWRWILWGDALGLAVFAVIGTQIALGTGSTGIVALLMGVLTATFGGVLRDLLAGEPTLIMRREIYVTAAFTSAFCYFMGVAAGISDSVLIPISVLAGFSLRALALRYRLRLPGHQWLGDDQNP